MPSISYLMNVEGTLEKLILRVLKELVILTLTFLVIVTGFVLYKVLIAVLGCIKWKNFESLQGEIITEFENETELVGSKAEEYNRLTNYLITILTSNSSEAIPTELTSDQKKSVINENEVYTILSAKETSLPEESAWLNLVIVRYWMLLFKSKVFIDDLKQRWTTLIAKKTATSSIVNKISISEISMGSGVPSVSEICIVKNADKNLSATLEASLNYGGGASLSIDALAFGSYKLEGSVNLSGFSSKIRVCCPAPDNNAYAAIAFVKYPKLDLCVNLSIPSQINKDIIRRAIGKILGYVLRRSLAEFLVLPKWYSLRLPLLTTKSSISEWVAPEIDLNRSNRLVCINKKPQLQDQYKSPTKLNKTKSTGLKDTTSQTKFKSSINQREDIPVYIPIFVSSDLTVDMYMVQKAQCAIFNFICSILGVKLFGGNKVSTTESVVAGSIIKDEAEQVSVSSHNQNEDPKISWRCIRIKCSIAIQKPQSFNGSSVVPRLRRSMLILQYNSRRVFDVLNDIEHCLFIDECCRGITVLKQLDELRSIIEIRYVSRARKEEDDIRFHLIQIVSEFKVESIDTIPVIKRINSDVVRISNDEPSYLILYRTVSYEADSIKSRSDLNTNIIDENYSLDFMNSGNPDTNLEPEKIQRRGSSIDLPDLSTHKFLPRNHKTFSLPACDISNTNYFNPKNSNNPPQKTYFKGYLIVPVVMSCDSTETRGSCLMGVSSYSRELEFFNVSLFSQKKLMGYIDSKCSVFDFSAGVLTRSAGTQRSTTLTSNIDKGKYLPQQNNFSDVIDLYSTTGEFEYDKQKNIKDSPLQQYSLSRLSKRFISKIKSSDLASLNMSKLSNIVSKRTTKDARNITSPDSPNTEHIIHRESVQSNLQKCDSSSETSTVATTEQSDSNIVLLKDTPYIKDIDIPDSSLEVGYAQKKNSGYESDSNEKFNADLLVSGISNNPPTDENTPMDLPMKYGNNIESMCCSSRSFFMTRINSTLDILDIDVPFQNETGELFVVWETYTSKDSICALSVYVVSSNLPCDDTTETDNKNNSQNSKTTLLLSETPVYSLSSQEPSIRGSAPLNLEYSKTTKIVFMCSLPVGIQSSSRTVTNCWFYKDVSSIPLLIQPLPLPEDYIVDNSKVMWSLNVSVIPESSLGILVFVKKMEYVGKPVTIFTQSTSPLLLFTVKFLDAEECQHVSLNNSKRKRFSLLTSQTQGRTKRTDIKGIFKMARSYAKKKIENNSLYKNNFGKISDPYLFSDPHYNSERPYKCSTLKTLSYLPPKYSLSRSSSSPTYNAHRHKNNVNHAETHGDNTIPSRVKVSSSILVPYDAKHTVSTPNQPEIYKDEIATNLLNKPSTKSELNDATSNKDNILHNITCGDMTTLTYNPSPSSPNSINRSETSSEFPTLSNIDDTHVLSKNDNEGDASIAGNYSTHEVMITSSEGYLSINIDNLVSQYHHEANIKICFRE